MTDRIDHLERIARGLEPDGKERASLVDATVSYADRFLEAIYDLPAFRAMKEPGIGLLESPVGESPLDLDSLLKILRENVDEPGLNPASGGHLGYIPGGGIYHSALADYLADVTNRYAGVYFAGPGAGRMENLLINWMAQIAGYPPHQLDGTDRRLSSIRRREPHIGGKHLEPFGDR